MTTRSWIRKRFARTPRTVRNNPAGYRPRLEALEERLTPAGPSTPTTLGNLPVDAQALVSATLGRDNTTYAASPAGNAFTLSNPAQHLSALLGPAAALLSSGSDTWSMALAQVGHGDINEAVGVATVQAQQNRVTYNYGALSQWFVNGPAGLEQGITLSQDPVGSDGTAPLLVDIRLGGSVHATANAAGDALTLSRSDGSTVWTYSGLEVFDASGRCLPTRMTVHSSGGHDDLVIQVNDVGARYPLTIDPLVQQAQLTASDGAANNLLGLSVAMSSDGTTVAAGDVGTVYVFVKPSMGGWANATQTAKLTASDGATVGGVLGITGELGISGDGSTVVAGAIDGNSGKGAAYVFVKQGTVWTSTTQNPIHETAKLTASDGAANDSLGQSVAISTDGSTIVAGAPDATEDIFGRAGPGAVYVFMKPSTGWANATQTAKLTASDGVANDGLGGRVAISGDGSTVVAGAVGGNSGNGAAYVFLKQGTVWTSTTQSPTHEAAKLTASDGANSDFFGSSVAISGGGSTVVVGAEQVKIGQNTNQGAAYVFVKQGTVWTSTTQNPIHETAKLTASDGAYQDNLGSSMAISGDGSTVVAGAFGAVYVFVKPPTGWTSTSLETSKLTITGTSWVGISGDGSTVVAGTPEATVAGNSDQGAVNVFGPTLKTPTINVTANNSIYNGSAYTVNAVIVEGQNNTTLASLTADPSTLSFTWYMGTGTSGTNLGSNAPKDAGPYTVVAHYTSDQAGYASADSTPQTFTITPKTLLVTGLSATNKYDATTADPLSGTAALLAAEAAGAGSTSDGKPYAGDSVTLGGTAVGTLSQKDVGTGLAVSVSGNTLSGAQLADYVLANNEQSGLTANIIAKTLLVSGLSATNKIYDATTTDPLSGTAALLAAEAAGSGTTGDGKPYSGDTLLLGGTAVGSFAQKDVGTGLAVSVSGNTLTGAQAIDYVLASNEQSGLTASITPKALTYSGLSVPANRKYNGGTNAVVSGTAVLLTAESPGTGSTSDSKPYSGDSVGLTGTPTGTYNSKDVDTAASVIFGGLSLTGANNADYSLTAGTQAATITPQTVTASIIGNPTKPYDGNTSATLTSANFSLSGLAGMESFTVTQTSGVYNSANVATATTVTASLTAGNFTPGNGVLASNYTLPSTASGPGQITQDSLSASGVNFSATAGAPFSGTVATFTTSDTADSAGAFTATILWGDGSTSNGIVMGSKGSFTVTGSHTFADPKASPGYAVSVQISNPNTKSGTANDAATVASLGQTVGKGLAGGIGFWHNQNGQALIHSFGSTATGQTLANWLATTFPNLYGPGTGSNNLTNQSNDQVAAYFETLFSLGGPKVQAEVLAVALNVYATTAALGGNALNPGAAYGFSVSTTGLGADSFSVSSDGAAFVVANNTTRNVDELLVAVNNQASNGILYNGNSMQSTLQGEAAALFDALNQAGSI
jgi:hypothetical protein